MKELLKLENSRDVTLSELADKTGFCEANVRRMIKEKNIALSYEERNCLVKREHLGKFIMKHSKII